MADDRTGIGGGARLLLVLAALTIVIAGMKAGAPVLLPMLSALFLSVLCVPPMRRLQKHGVPAWLAIVLVVSGATVIVFLVTGVMGKSLAQFQEQMPFYKERLQSMMVHALEWVRARGLDIPTDDLASRINTGKIVQLATDTASGLLSALSNLVVVVLMMVFMLVEANDIPKKLKLALHDPEVALSDFSAGAEQIQKYLAIKTVVSMATGILAALLCWLAGVDAPLLWGLIAFVFNYVPNIGSVIAAVPPALLALIQHGASTAGLVAAGYVAINMVIGNAIEPRLMGRRLGLSTLVVFLSLVFWGWVWGPLGMLLSVPLTVIVKIALEHTDDFRWLGIMLGTATTVPPPTPSMPKSAQRMAMPHGDADDPDPGADEES